MLKFSIGFIHLAGLFILGLFAANVSVTDNIPESIEPGGFATVEVKVSKGDVQGFAKLQLDIPAGLSVSPVDTKGASFTFSGGKAKFIWMTLPEMSDFTVTYKLKALPETSGTFTIGGIFSYIEENNRVDYNLSPKKLVVGNGIAAETVATESPEETLVETTEPLPAIEPEVVSVANDGSSRVITSLGDNNYSVKVSIAGSGAKGYAKIEERLNPAYKVSPKNSGGSVFTQENGLLKFVWFDAPQTDKLEVIYQVTASELPKISGEFFFIDNNAPARMAIAPSKTAEQALAVKTEKAIENPGITPPVSNSTVSEKTESVINTPVKTDTVKPDATAKVESKVTNQETVVAAKTKEVKQEQPKMSAVPGPEKGVTYKVQIAAGPNTVGKTYFTSKHNFSETFQIENHEGWVKYTTGSHNAYGEARNNRERIRSNYNFDGPFVTAYNNGERITVQEALLITQQQWLP